MSHGYPALLCVPMLFMSVALLQIQAQQRDKDSGDAGLSAVEFGDADDDGLARHPMRGPGHRDAEVKAARKRDRDQAKQEKNVCSLLPEY